MFAGTFIYDKKLCSKIFLCKKVPTIFFTTTSFKNPNKNANKNNEHCMTLLWTALIFVENLALIFTCNIPNMMTWKVQKSREMFCYTSPFFWKPGKVLLPIERVYFEKLHKHSTDFNIYLFIIHSKNNWFLMGITVTSMTVSVIEILRLQLYRFITQFIKIN